eukprot:3293094-Rhodomonas_salina.2
MPSTTTRAAHRLQTNRRRNPHHTPRNTGTQTRHARHWRAQICVCVCGGGGAGLDELGAFEPRVQRRVDCPRLCAAPIYVSATSINGCVASINGSVESIMAVLNPCMAALNPSMAAWKGADLGGGA